MISSSANRYFTFWQRTAFVLDAVAAAATLVLDRAINAECFLQVEVAGGTTGSGTVTITGTDPEGNAQVEALVFTMNSAMQTTGRWQAGSTPTVTTTGLDDESAVPTVAISTVGADGQAQLQLVSKATSRPVLVSALGGADWKAGRQGTQETGRAYFDVDYEEVWTPDVGFVAIEDATADEWTVQAVDEVRVGFGVRPRHWRLTCQRYDT